MGTQAKEDPTLGKFSAYLRHDQVAYRATVALVRGKKLQPSEYIPILRKLVLKGWQPSGLVPQHGAEIEVYYYGHMRPSLKSKAIKRRDFGVFVRESSSFDNIGHVRPLNGPMHVRLCYWSRSVLCWRLLEPPPLELLGIDDE